MPILIQLNITTIIEGSANLLIAAGLTQIVVFIVGYVGTLKENSKILIAFGILSLLSLNLLCAILAFVLVSQQKKEKKDKNKVDCKT